MIRRGAPSTRLARDGGCARGKHREDSPIRNAEKTSREGAPRVRAEGMSQGEALKISSDGTRIGDTERRRAEGRLQ